VTAQPKEWIRVTRFSPVPAMAVCLALLSSVLSPAASLAGQDQPAYPKIKIASPINRTFQAVTGFTPLSGLVANRLLHRELARHIQGNLHSRLSLFSGSDLFGRKVRGIRISGRNVLLENYIPLSEFRFESQSDTPLYLSKNKRPILLRPAEFKVSATMTEADMNRMLSSERGQRLLTGMKVSIPPFGPQYLDVINPSVKLEGDRLNIASLLNTHGSPPENALPIQVSGRVYAENSSLALSDLDLRIEGMQNTDDIEQLIENYFSELVDLSHIKVERHRLKIHIEKSEVTDHTLNLQATVSVTPDKKALKKALQKAAKKPGA